MLKKTVTYTDYDGNTVTEDFYFNLTKAELTELEVSEKDGFAETIKKIVEAEDGARIIDGFKRILLLSYGKRSEDGKRFVKNDQIREDFESSAAFSDIFMELAMNAEAGAAFVNNVIPKDLSEKAQQQTLLEKTKAKVEEMHLPDNSIQPTIPYDEAVQTLTDEQLRSMSQEELSAHFRSLNPNQ